MFCQFVGSEGGLTMKPSVLTIQEVAAGEDCSPKPPTEPQCLLYLSHIHHPPMSPAPPASPVTVALVSNPSPPPCAVDVINHATP